ncbi:hypothetical protein [Haemophilus parainfluenzae]|uniref:hypothetical protein n=1 Tax=Haemophilus parainfluenzae TaxID=729 RepID=UPI001E53CA91|nr:hypothetical protein [Haemophilus parainfluenzae]
MKERLTILTPPQITAVQLANIRQERGGIIGPIYVICQNHHRIEPSTAYLFEYRFTGEGELSGHNLGNLMP